MKNKTETGLDFIGGHRALTKAEEVALSVYFQKQKNTTKKSTIRSSNKHKTNNATV